MEKSDLLSIITIVALLAVIAVLYFRLRKYSHVIDKISDFAGSLLRGSYKKLEIEEDGFDNVATLLNALSSDMHNRINDISEEKNRIHSILNCMTDGILITDTKGKITLANPAVKSLLNIKSNVAGESVIVATRLKEIHDIVAKVIETEEEVIEEIDIPYPVRISIMAVAAPLYSYEVKERISGVVISLHDITRIKQLEEMRKTFVANVSHEIKTPITAIKGFAETLLDGAIDDRHDALRFIETIKSHSERLNALVEDILTISRIELGDIKIEKRPVNIEQVIDSVFATLKDKAHSKGLYLRKDLSPAITEIQADRDRLVQILLNLVENGIKFTEDGGVTIGTSDAGGVPTLSVEDTGVGIPREHIPRVGERFYRVDAARSRDMGGTGLGLAIVKHIVKAHDWEMNIESAHGKGTRVNIRIPN